MSITILHPESPVSAQHNLSMPTAPVSGVMQSSMCTSLISLFVAQTRGFVWLRVFVWADTFVTQ